MLLNKNKNLIMQTGKVFFSLTLSLKKKDAPQYKKNIKHVLNM